MPRINIEMDLFTDSRFLMLIAETGNYEAALGALVHLWIVGAKLFLETQGVISDKVWHRERLHHKLITCEFVVLTEGGYYISGAIKHFQWIKIASDKGKKSGAMRIAKSHIDEMNRTAVEPQLNRGGTSSLLFSAPLCSALLNSKRKNNTCSPNGERKSFDLDKIYQTYPRKQGKSSGLRKLKGMIKTSEDYESLKIAIERFVEFHRSKHTEPQFIPHFSTFVNQWRDWLDPLTGTTDSRIGRQTIADILED